MTQLFEVSNISDFCNVGALDSEFYIPIDRKELQQLRLVIPYQYVTLNGGGLPISAVDLSIVNNTGSSTLCNYGDPSTGNYMFSYINDSVNRIAEYKFFFGLGLADENGANCDIYGFNPVTNDVIEIDVNGTMYSFVYGVDEVPLPFIEYYTGSIAIMLNSTDYSNTTIKINNIVDSLTFPLSIPHCAHENFDCFRFKIEVVFSNYGETKTFYSHAFKVPKCDEETIYLTGTYPDSAIDCGGHLHSGTGAFVFQNKHYLRIYGGIKKMPDEVGKEYNTRSRAYKSYITKKKNLKGEPVPLWFADALQTVLLGKNVRFDNEELYPDDDASYLEDIEINGMTYQNINVNLRSSKCENIFVC